MEYFLPTIIFFNIGLWIMFFLCINKNNIVKERKIKKDIPGALMEREKVEKMKIQYTYICVDNYSPKVKRLAERMVRLAEKSFRMEYKDCNHMWE